MPWYWIALIVCLVIGPFDALYLYIKAQKRRDRLRREKDEDKRKNCSAANRQISFSVIDFPRSP